MFNILHNKMEVNEKEGKVTCRLQLSGGFEIIGIAKCASQDSDFFNQYTGSFIAFQRALIKLYKVNRSYQKNLLKEYIRIRESIKYGQDAYYKINEMIEDQKEVIKYFDKEVKRLENDLNIYIGEKNHFYDTLREARERWESK